MNLCDQILDLVQREQMRIKEERLYCHAEGLKIQRQELEFLQKLILCCAEWQNNRANEQRSGL